MIMSNINSQPTILITDDNPENISILGEILKDHYNIKIAVSGKQALKIMWEESPLRTAE